MTARVVALILACLIVAAMASVVMQTILYKDLLAARVEIAGLRHRLRACPSSEMTPLRDETDLIAQGGVP